MQTFPNLRAIGFSYTELHRDTKTVCTIGHFSLTHLHVKKNTAKELSLETLYYAYIPGLRYACWLGDLGITE